MKNKSSEGKKISRRNVLPLLGGSIFLPFLGFGNTKVPETTDSENDSYQTLLKPDGTVVKIKTSTLKNSKIIEKDISNKSLLSWIKKKF